MAENTPLIQSVDRAMAILDIIASTGENGIALKELSQKIGLNSSTTHHLVSTLSGRRVIEQDPLTRRYRLGLHLIELGSTALRSTSLARVAQPFLQEVWDVTGQTVTLLVFHGLMRTPLVHVQSRQMLTATSAPLEVATLHATGSGKLLLAYISEQELEHYLSIARLERFTSATISSPERLKEELACIRETGISTDREEFSGGVCCIATPVQDASRKVIACLDMIFPSFEMHPEDLSRMADHLKQVASGLSIKLREIGLVVN